MPSTAHEQRPRAAAFSSWPLILTLTVVLALLIAGCGSDDGIDDGQSDSPPVAAAETPAPPDPAILDDATGEAFNAARVYRESVPGVISVRSVFEDGAAGGSGFVLSDKGEIVTNAHVITEGEGVDRRPANKVYVEFFDGNVVAAEIIGFDPFADVGLLKIDPGAVDLTPLKLTDSEGVQVGQPIAVIGSPFGEDHSLSTGVVSQTGRSVRSLTDFQIEGAIQTDASINPGNSGGPMLDAQDRVMGISQQIKGGSGASDGVGFGVPSNAIMASVRQLRDGGKANYAFIGVSTQPVYPQLADKLGIDAETGALVAEVVSDGPADDAGIRGGEDEIRFQGIPYTTGGDVIVSAGGEPIERAEDLGRIISELEPGKTVELGVIRDDKKIEVKVDLDERPTAVTAP